MPEQSAFDRAIATHESGPHTRTGEFTDDWLIGHAVNGGVALAMAGSALAAELGGTGHPDPFVISAYYLAASSPGPVTVHTETVRTGRQVATGEVSLWQDGPDGEPVQKVRALATYGSLDSLPDDVRTAAEPPPMPGPEDCTKALDAPAEAIRGVNILHQLDLRIDPATAGWAVGRPSGRGQLRGWLRMPDGREPDPYLLLMAVDAMPPVAFDLGVTGWAPTVELTAHVRARPAPGWLQIVTSSRNLAGGFLEEDADVWDSTGRLVAQARQLARVPG